MAWHQIHFALSADLAEGISDSLLNHGALTVTIESYDLPGQQTVEVFGEPGHETETLWPWCTLTVLINLDTDAKKLIEAACHDNDLTDIPAFQIDLVHDQDWITLTQNQFEPISITSQLWIVPSWHQPPNPNAINIRIDPGQAFGTGSHPTTQLCLKGIADEVNPDTTLLDYGCGSGILAIAAKKLGAQEVIGVDIDEAAIQAANINSQLNNVNARFFSSQSWITDHAFDGVVANILSAPLKVLAPLLVSYVKPGGWLMLSGILAKQSTEVINCYTPWIKLEVRSQQEDWICLFGKKD